MSTTGLEVLDSSLQRTHIWLDEVMAELGPDRRLAWHALGAVLRALRDRLSLELNAHLAAQLPLMLRGLYFDQWTPGALARPGRSWEAFLQQIADGLANTRPLGAADAAATVFRALSRHLTEGQVSKVLASLPDSIREQWLSANHRGPVQQVASPGGGQGAQE